jgi:peptide/nickel transport system permease protein
MLNYAIRRILLLIPTLLLVTIIVFLLVRFMPGNVIDLMIQEIWEGTPGSGIQVDRDEIMARMGLDQPIWTQYGRWLGVLPTPDQKTGESHYEGILQGNLGKSLRTNRNMTDEIVKRIPVTFELGLLAILTGNIIAIPIGIYSAIRQDTGLDYIGRTFSILALSVPSFWLATMLIVYGARDFGWAPSVEYVRFSENPIENLKDMILPAALIGMSMSGGTMRFMRTMTLEVLRQDYIRTAWAKGLKERVIIIRHGVRNALIPLISLLAPQIGLLIGGSVIIEQIFVIPGMGQYLLTMILERDYWIVSGMNLIFAASTMLIVLATDLSYAWVDPRIRYR